MASEDESIAKKMPEAAVRTVFIFAAVVLGLDALKSFPSGESTANSFFGNSNSNTRN